MATIPNSRIIHAPSAEVKEMIVRRMPASARAGLEGVRIDAIGLIQANICNIFFYADIAQKAAAIYPAELHGSCPQQIVTLALFGDVSAVQSAMKAIGANMAGEKS